MFFCIIKRDDAWLLFQRQPSYDDGDELQTQLIRLLLHQLQHQQNPDSLHYANGYLKRAASKATIFRLSKDQSSTKVPSDAYNILLMQ